MGVSLHASFVPLHFFPDSLSNHCFFRPKCDGFMVASNRTDVSIGTVNIQHEGPEEYNNIWQKVRSMWSYVYDHYYEKYDWFHIGGDDLYLIVENLRNYVESEEIKTAANGGIYLPAGTETEQVPLFLGRRFAYQGDMDEIFNSGGSGYTMNKAALKLLVVDGFVNYFQHLKTFSEDTMVARVFKKYNVFPYETKDKNGGERYMPFLPGHHYGYRLPADSDKDWYAKYSINIKEGMYFYTAWTFDSSFGSLNIIFPRLSRCGSLCGKKYSFSLRQRCSDDEPTACTAVSHMSNRYTIDSQLFSHFDSVNLLY